MTTDAARADAEAVAEALAEAYYGLICTNFRKHDPNHLLLGSRWQPKTADRAWLCRAAGKHLDVVSVNYYTASPDPSFVSRIYDWSGGRPQMWSEFFYTSTTESNCGSLGYDYPTQRARGAAYSNYLHVATSLDCVTGIEWFTLVDQAATGRYFEGTEGERFNSGLFNVADRPYKDLLDGMLGAHLETYGRLLGVEATSAPTPRVAGGRALAVSGRPGTWGAKASVTVANPYRGAYYTVFTSTDLRGVFRAEGASLPFASGGGALELLFDASAPVKFARIAVSAVPYAENAAYPSVGQ